MEISKRLNEFLNELITVAVKANRDISLDSIVIEGVEFENTPNENNTYHTKLKLGIIKLIWD